MSIQQRKKKAKYFSYIFYWLFSLDQRPLSQTRKQDRYSEKLNLRDRDVWLAWTNSSSFCRKIYRALAVKQVIVSGHFLHWKDFHGYFPETADQRSLSQPCKDTNSLHSQKQTMPSESQTLKNLFLVPYVGSLGTWRLEYSVKYYWRHFSLWGGSYIFCNKGLQSWNSQRLVTGAEDMNDNLLFHARTKMKEKNCFICNIHILCLTVLVSAYKRLKNPTFHFLQWKTLLLRKIFFFLFITFFKALLHIKVYIIFLESWHAYFFLR